MVLKESVNFIGSDVFGVYDDVAEQLLFELFGCVSPGNKCVNHCILGVVAHECGVGDEGGHAFHVLRHKPSTPIKVIEMLSEVEVIECEHCRTDGAFEEVVHGMEI